ncbi:MAG: CYTH domain-containing protein, partial [Chloroflexi bacterium]
MAPARHPLRGGAAHRGVGGHGLCRGRVHRGGRFALQDSQDGGLSAAEQVLSRLVARPKRDRAIESELKFRLTGPNDHAKLRAILRERGAHMSARYREENFRFNGPGKSTRNTTLRLRVLNGGPHGVLTAKGPARFDDGVKTREETEIEVKDVHAILDMLEQLGFRVGWTYPKRRTLWMLDGVAVTLDVLDFGWFLELEGPAGALPDMARSFGLDPAHALK